MTGAYLGQENKISLRVQEADPKEMGHGIARMNPADILLLGIKAGDVISIFGKEDAVAKVLPANKEYRGKSILQIDGILRANAGVGIDDEVIVRKCTCFLARSITLSPVSADDNAHPGGDAGYIAKLLEGLPVRQGNRVRITVFGSRSVDWVVTKTSPGKVVLIHSGTALEIMSTTDERKSRAAITYEDIGGLRTEIQRIREMIELPFRFPEIFERIGIDPPKGVLLYGPPGTGKTLIAQAIATETDAHFIAVNGPEIVHKFYGESESHLRSVFEEAAGKAPAIIFIDEIDAIAPKRTEVSGELEKRVVGQLLAMMDGLEKRKQAVVIGATNIPDALDPALRRPGRFDREIFISVPDKGGREEILEIHTRGMPLAKDVDLTKLAEITHGFVGADLEALCREAGMSAVREIIPVIDFQRNYIPNESLLGLEVTMDHFTCALGEIEPSAIRELLVEIPNVMWDDIGGLSEIKEALKKAIVWPLKYKELFDYVKAGNPKGVLLAGPPGTGKTLIAKAVASESNANFISVKGPALFSKFVGESEKKLREVFKKAKQAAPCVIFFDEIDALSSARTFGESDLGVGQRVISQMLTELDGVEELKGVVVLAATNRIELIDPALLRQGRFDYIFRISEPNLQDRCEIFQLHLTGRPIADGVDLMELARRTPGMVGSDIYSICEKAALRAIKKFLTCGEDCLEHLIIAPEDLDLAIDEVARMKVNWQLSQ